MKCAFCGGKIPASTASVTVNVAPEFEHEGPRGTFHITNSGENCYDLATAQHKVDVNSRGRLHADVETLLGCE